MARLARASARSFSGWPVWPRTQCHSMRCGAAAASSRGQRSTVFTGSRSAVFQPLLFQAEIHSVMPRRTYCESVVIATVHGRLSASSPAMAAISSMRLLVVRVSPPYRSFSVPLLRSTTPHPPGPGLPRQAPSVYISTTSAMLDLTGGGLHHFAAAGERPLRAPAGLDGREGRHPFLADHHVHAGKHWPVKTTQPFEKAPPPHHPFVTKRRPEAQRPLIDDVEAAQAEPLPDATEAEKASVPRGAAAAPPCQPPYTPEAPRIEGHDHHVALGDQHALDFAQYQVWVGRELEGMVQKHHVDAVGPNGCGRDPPLYLRARHQRRQSIVQHYARPDTAFLEKIDRRHGTSLHQIIAEQILQDIIEGILLLVQYRRAQYPGEPAAQCVSFVFVVRARCVRLHPAHS